MWAFCASGILLAARPSHAAVDLTGRWYALTSSFYFGQNLPMELDIVQDGTSLTIAFRDQAPAFANGTIDPETGVFSLVAQNTLSYFCIGSPPPGRFEGTASSSDLFTATWTTWTGEFVDCFPLAISVGAKRSQCGLPGQLCVGGPSNLGAMCCEPTCDAFQSEGTACRLDQNLCTRDMCDGAGSCVGAPAEAGTECRAARILCDVAERCDGVSTQCPADQFLPAGTLCPDSSANPCGRYICVATGGCVEEIFPPGNLCRSGFNECGIEQYCDENGDCPVGVARPPGTPCAADDNPCTLDECNGRFSCSHLPAPDATACDDGDPRTANDLCLGGMCAGVLESRLVRDLRPGPDSSTPGAFVAVDGILFFVADDGEHGRELWRSDGTNAGSRMVIDLNPGAADAFHHPEHLVTADNTLFFGADDGRGGAQLWRSDGTEAGTVLVKDIAAGEPSAAVRNLTVLDDGTIAFMVATGFYTQQTDVEGRDRLWTSDGTEDETVTVADLGFFRPGPFGDEVLVHNLFPFNGGLLAALLGQTECCEMDSLVRLEPNGETETVFHRNQAGHRQSPSVPGNLTVTEDGALFFTVDGRGGDCELMRTDGTASGTTRVELLGMRCRLSDLVSDRDSLIFTRYESSHGSSDNALWRVGSSGLDPTLIVVAGRGVSDATKLGSTLFFVTDAGNGRELWKSDGTETGTMEVRDLNVGPAGSNPTALTIVDGRLLFAADDGVAGPSLWSTDGAADGTIRVGSLPSDHTQLFSRFVTAGSDVFFSTYDEAHGAELWALARLAIGGVCPADCDANRSVNVDELIVSVNIALGSAPLSRCTVADFDGNGQVTVDELVAAVNRALEGCA